MEVGFQVIEVLKKEMNDGIIAKLLWESHYL